MRIAQVLAFQESRPIDFRESRARVVSYLTEELVRQGHEIVVLAGAMPDRSAVASCDVVHFHLDRAAIPSGWRRGLPSVATLHSGGGGRAGSGGSLGGTLLVAVSEAQRARLPSLPWFATVPYGIPAEGFRFHEGGGGYLAVVGAMCPGEGIDRAIEIARRCGRRLRIAANEGETNARYFRTEIAPLLTDPHVAVVSDHQNGDRNRLLGNAVALLQVAGSRGIPDLTALEALASGTPVVHCGPLAEREPSADGIVGFAASTISDAVQAVDRASRLERRRCREVFELGFTANRMAREYLALYGAALERSVPKQRMPPTAAAHRQSLPEA